jgi:alanine racemase
MYKASDILKILQTHPADIAHPDAEITYLSTDSRRLNIPHCTLFFALPGHLHDGAVFIMDAIEKGVCNIVASRKPEGLPAHVNVFLVLDPLQALQHIARHHREAFPGLEVVAITGSNGKTIVKEWLAQLITDKKVIKSPKSYNSQTGVALSLWQISVQDEVGIFEAGISRTGEMARLEAMIRPETGIFTMIGDAHAEGFVSRKQKLYEKLILFRHAKTIIFNADDAEVAAAIHELYPDKQICSWGASEKSTLFHVTGYRKLETGTLATLKFENQSCELLLPFIDPASVQNALHCIAYLLHKRYKWEYIAQAVGRLHNISMRLELKKGILNTLLINDTYNADIQSLVIALDFLQEQAGFQRNKILVISDFLQTGLTESAFCEKISALILSHNISVVAGIGPQLAELHTRLNPTVRFLHFDNTEDLLHSISEIVVPGSAILVKGARVFRLERVITALSDKAHTAILETDLQAVGHNLSYFSSMTSPETRIIAVVKAAAYGSGGEELARFLQFRKVGYLAVAFIDEGVQLRTSGISMPIMVLNPDRNGIEALIKHQLEPEVYSLEQLEEISAMLESLSIKNFPVHIKLDTGMHRLGFMPEEVNLLCDVLEGNPSIQVASVFSHLSSSEDPDDDAFTHAQVQMFLGVYEKMVDRIGYRPMRHILNSSGIVRFMEYHFEMVRLGLGLYGIDSSQLISLKLEKVHTLKATVIQIKQVGFGGTVGYNRKGKIREGSRVAIINIGYADGLIRLAGNGHYKVVIQNREYPITGNICMDLTIVDIGTDIHIRVGDEVIIFGKMKPVEELAAVCKTIPYEILSRISGRVRRVFVQG